MNYRFWCTFARICIYLGVKCWVLGIWIFSFTRKCCTVFQNDCTSAQAVTHENSHRATSFPIVSHTSAFKYCPTSEDVKITHCGFNLSFFEVEYLFICLLDIHVFYEMHVQWFAHYSPEGWNYLNILDIVLSVIHDTSILSKFVACIFSLPILSLGEQFLILVSSKPFVLWFMQFLDCLNFFCTPRL